MKEKLKKMLCFKNIVLWLACIAAIVAFILAMTSIAKVAIHYSKLYSDGFKTTADYEQITLTLGQFLKDGKAAFDVTMREFHNGQTLYEVTATNEMEYVSTSVAKEIVWISALGLLGGLGLAASTFIPDKASALRVISRLVSIFLIVMAVIETMAAFKNSNVIDFKDGIIKGLTTGLNPLTMGEALEEYKTSYTFYFNNTCNAGVPFIISLALGGMGLVVKTPEEAARKAQKKAEKAEKKAAKYNK